MTKETVLALLLALALGHPSAAALADDAVVHATGTAKVWSDDFACVTAPVTFTVERPGIAQYVVEGGRCGGVVSWLGPATFADDGTVVLGGLRLAPDGHLAGTLEEGVHVEGYLVRV